MPTEPRAEGAIALPGEIRRPTRKTRLLKNCAGEFTCGPVAVSNLKIFSFFPKATCIWSPLSLNPAPLLVRLMRRDLRKHVRIVASIPNPDPRERQDPKRVEIQRVRSVGTCIAYRKHALLHPTSDCLLDSASASANQEPGVMEAKVGEMPPVHARN